MDKILTDINAFGRYQKLILLIIGTMSSLNAMAIYVTIFTAAEPKLLCKYKNDTSPSPSYLSNTCEIWSNLTQDSTGYSPFECIWDEKYYGLTLINEWNLICDRIYFAGLTQTIFMIGGLSCFFMGYFSDKYGRKAVCLAMSILMSFGIIMSETLQLKVFNLDVNTKYTVYVISQFILGFTSYSLYVTSYVLLLEITTTKYSTIVSNFNLYMYVVGELMALMLGYFVKNWHVINWLLAAYSIIIILIIKFFLPESPRFLLANQKYEEAFVILKQIARLNGKSDSLISEIELRDDTQSSDLLEKEKTESSTQIEKNVNKQTVIEYLRNPIFNLIKTLLLIYIWISLSMIYYGEGLGITQISAEFNPFLMCFLSSLSETIGYIFCYLNDKYSRKKVLIGFLASASIMCLSVVLIPLPKSSSISLNSILIIIFASIGKSMASAAFNSAYMFTSQSYPTSVRNTLVSIVSCSARIGSLISPQINLLRSLVWAPLPYLIFSGASLVACVFTFFLPDTSKLKYQL